MKLTVAALALGLVGCSGGEPEPGAAAAVGAPTWYQDVAPIVVENCAGCHADGGLGGVALDHPELAVVMSESMAHEVETRSMPPWGAYDTEECTAPLPLVGDLRLTDEEIQVVVDWAAAGAPLGDPESPAETSPPVSVTLGDDFDDEIYPQASHITAGESDEFICFTLDPGLDEGRWLTGLEVLPGNTEVVHHALIFIDSSGDSVDLADDDGKYTCFGSAKVDGSLVGAWAPGSLPSVTPEGSGTWLPAGARLAMQIHYHPSGATAEPDLTGVRLRYADEDPEYEAEIVLIGNARNARNGLISGPNDSSDRPEFLIPAGAKGHTETMYFDLPNYADGIQVYQASTHMHYLGVDGRVWIERQPETDGTEECLIQTPEYSFEWQRGYTYEGSYDDFPSLSAGDRLWVECTYDNTLDNEGARAALEDAGLSEPQDVSLGDETLDEMCLMVLGITYPR